MIAILLMGDPMIPLHVSAIALPLIAMGSPQQVTATVTVRPSTATNLLVVSSTVIALVIVVACLVDLDS